MPHLERRPGGWRVVSRVGGRGSRRIVSPLFPSRVAAEAERRAIAAKQALRQPSRLAIIALPDLIARWAAANRGSEAYQAKAVASLDALAAARGWTSLTDLRPSDLDGLLISQVRYLRALGRWARRSAEQSVPDCVTDLVSPRRPRRPATPLLTDAQVEALTDRADALCPGSGRAIAHLVSTYGHRPESLSRLRCADLDLSVPALTLVVKSGDTIRHPILPQTADLLAPLAHDQPPAGPLLRRPEGVPWRSGQAIAEWWHHYVGKAVVPAAPGIYQMKRYAITRMIQTGIDVATIASITGHRCPAVILVYARTNESRQTAALAALSRLGDTRCHPEKS
jgi:hypothetical protein